MSCGVNSMPIPQKNFIVKSVGCLRQYLINGNLREGIIRSRDIKCYCDGKFVRTVV